MQFKLSLVTVTLATVVAAIPTGGGNNCNIESQQCCDSVQQAGSYNTQSLQALGLLGIPLVASTSLLALPALLSAFLQFKAIPGSSAQPVCCSNNNFNGVVALGCTPINVNL
ncbi:hypothetical protein BDQ17DRAFT_1423197 [Cyathus striatus]|nr:hypothetical protein BDQ17DRAFT_1423197 [Cyathus striatus]